MNRRIVVAVIGAGQATEPVTTHARELGRLVGEQGWVLITGGRNTGVMRAANIGAKEAKDSLTIGILPDRDAEVSPDVDVAIVTGMGEARNNVIVLTADVVIACGVSEAGTASEVSLAIKNGKDVIILAATEEVKRFFGTISPEELNFADSPEEAVQAVNQLLGRIT